MKRNVVLFLMGIVFLKFGFYTNAFAVSNTGRIVTATEVFLSTLSADQKTKVQFPFTPDKAATTAKFKGGMNGQMDFVGEQYGKAVWSNFPVSDVPRPGLPLKSLSAKQQDALRSLLQTLLSKRGYEKVIAIMGADQVLSEGGTHYAAGRGYYTVGFFGKPSATSPWMIEFGGHHLGLNVTIFGEKGIMTPTLTGAQPALYKLNGKTIRPMGAENDKAFLLLNALDENQRKEAVLNYEVSDLVVGPGHFGDKIQPEGIKISEMNQKQKTLLLDVISEWAAILNDDYSKTRIEEIKNTLDDTYFAWSGPLTHVAGKNGSSYYRIQGPKVIIEFAPQGTGGDSTLHVHTMYRDPTNDYGISYLNGK